MSDRVPPKSKKAAKAKAAKKAPGPKLAKDTIVHGMGHNSGQKVPGVIKIVDELLHMGEQKKAMAKAERDLRNKAKTEFGIMAGPLAHEIRLRKMDEDVRVQFESNHSDLKVALGYQPELDFAGATPTQASVKAQPPEAQMKKPLTDADHPIYNQDDDDDEGYSVEDEDDGDDEGEQSEEPTAKDPLEIPENLRRPKRDVIEREG